MGQSFGASSHYAVISNLGELCMVLMVLILIDEVDKDVKAATEFEDFLDVVGEHDEAQVIEKMNRKEKEKVKGSQKEQIILLEEVEIEL